MQRYRWQGHEMKLLGELQRQQNNAQFCDTLLQTEGISVPTHSCVLAALSPYLFQKLLASPSPPSGQKRQLQLQAVKAQTLLKLVGLLYSGELEVRGSVELDDVLSTAHQFGIVDLVGGRKDGGAKEGARQKKSVRRSREREEEEGEERNDGRKMQNAQVQAERTAWRAADCPVERMSCVSSGTQTVKAGEKTAGTSSVHSGQTESPTQEPASSAAQSLDLQPQNISLDGQSYSSCFPHFPSRPPSDTESTSQRSSNGVTNPTSTLAPSADVTSFPVCLSDDSNSPLPQTDDSGRHSSEFWERTGTGTGTGKGPRAEKTDGEMADRREDTERPGLSRRDEIRGEGKGSHVERKHAQTDVGEKSLDKIKCMQQMMETTQFSIKVKLRRNSKGKVWEVVSMQDADETSSALTALEQTDLANGPHKRRAPFCSSGPDASILHPEPPPHPGATHHRNADLDSAPPPQPPASAEESDEQIEKLLDDIMMSLNILPEMDSDCKKPHHLGPSLDGAPATCQVAGAESGGPAVGAAGCVYWQDFGAQIGHSSTDTAQNQPSCASLSSDAVLIQQQQQQPPSPHYHSSVTSMGRRDGATPQSMPLSDGQTCLYPEALATRSALPSAFYSSGQKPHDPACQEPSARDDQSILQFLPPTDGNEALSFSLPCMDDLRLPPCLSPLRPFASAPKHQQRANRGDHVQPRPPLRGRPWLGENPGSLQFPLGAVAHRENRNVSSPQDANHSCWPKQWQKHLEPNAQNSAVEGGETASAGCQSAAEVKSDHGKMMESLKSNEGDATGDAAAPKRRRRKRASRPQAASASLLAHKDVKVSDGANQINLGVCSVRLSSNNVLAKEREMAVSSANVVNGFVAKPESHGETTKAAGSVTNDSTRIRTRSFLRRTQAAPSKTSREKRSVSKPRARRAKMVSEQGVSIPKRKRGRPPRAKREETPPALGEEKSHGVESEQQIGNDLPNEAAEEEEEEGENAKRRCKQPRRNRSEVEVIPLEKIRGAEADDGGEIIPAERKHGPRMVSLKEFRKLIKRRRSKTRRSTDSKRDETNETERGVEIEEKACRSGGEEFKETEMDTDAARPQIGDGPEESRVTDDVAVDKNHNLILNRCQRDDMDTSSTLLGNESDPMRSLDVSGDEVAEREQPLRSPDKAQKACDTAVSDTAQQNAISKTHMPPQDLKMPLDHKLNSKTPERTAPPLPTAAIKGSEEEMEEEEEVEVDVDVDVDVDVVLYSPEKVPQSRECDNRLDNVEVTPEEEEEEDVNEIDVTGDEAE